jgi:uncharacterized metal-binding protein
MGTDTITLEVTGSNKICAAGEKYGRACRSEGKIPVLSCEGACIKGEIARQAANLVAKHDGYARACHGELFTLPQADLAGWVREARKVVLIDGCPLSCHGRIAGNIIAKDRLIIFDALSIHRKYATLMDVDDVPETERMRAAGEVADRVLADVGEGIPCCSNQSSSSEGGCSPLPERTCT